jgi:hypothetical protein
MKRRNRRQYKDPSPPLSIYFIGVGSYLFIKIGVSEDVEKELKNIQERNPSYPLTLLGYISGCDEKAEKGLFEKLIDFHIGKGWFERSLEMEECLDWFEEDSSLKGIED